MRKQIKKIIALVMSAALAITAGAGINMTKSSAAKKPDFKASLWSFSTFAGWTGAASDTVEVKDFGEYTLTGEATENLDDLFKSDNATAVVLGESNEYSAAVAEIGIDNFEIVGKSIQINDGDVIPWNVTPVDWAGARLAIHNAWNEDIDFKTDKVAPIKAGDKIKVTFEVKAKDTSNGSSDVTKPGTIETSAHTEADLRGTAQLDSQANGWCGNDDCTNVKATINGPGTYTVSSTWEEVQDDPQAYCTVRIADLDKIAGYVTFSNVTIWVDGNVVDMPVIYGGDGDCRLQLWNTWGIPDDGSSAAGCEVPANFPESFYEIKVQFTIGLRNTERNFKVEGHDSSLISMDTTQPNYEPINKPNSIVKPTVQPTASPTVKPTVRPTIKPTAVPTVSPDDNTEEEDDDIEDPVIYAKKSVTKHIGDKDFDIDNGIYSDGEVSYESSNKKVVTVDRNGSVRIKGCGIAIITIFVDETENFYMDTKDVKVTVLPNYIKAFKVKSIENGIKCIWKKMNFNNVKCIIQASENKKFKKPVIAKPYSELKKGYWKGVGLKVNKTYYIRIRQIAKFSNKQFKYGKWSKVIKVKIK